MERQSCTLIAKTISNLLPKDAAFAIADERKFLYYQPGQKIDIHLKPGEDLREGTVTYEALKARQQSSRLVEKSIFGVPYYATSYPIIEENHLEGFITIISPPKQRQQFAQSQPFLIGKGEDRWIPIPFNDIYYIESNNGKTLIYSKQGIFQNKFNLTELEARLPIDQFVRCHRAFIIRISSILEIHPNFHSTFTLLVDDKENSKVPVSQRYASTFRRLLGF
ncbi:LytTR family DNA-binding domain-containing protein [Bacillus tianshenii]|nr:LytTR family DNA-binding domain-containing protein [Bacillus tianshenii]